MFTVSRKELKLAMEGARNYLKNHEDAYRVELFITKNGKFKLVVMDTTSVKYTSANMHKREMWPIGDFYRNAQMYDSSVNEIITSIKTASIMLADSLHYEWID